ncbi:MAG: class I tRNA ligase family protein, partial [Thermomicrobiales bacterium]|nr:class I tRNA ligase family protein [Thermomicrobiales bacterium]
MTATTTSGIQRVNTRPDFPALERETLAWWEANDILEKYLHRNDDSAERYSFLDGPITANNPMGVHHAWGRTYKDVFQRYFAMNGRDQRFQNGFDCQGLWVEIEVEKTLGYSTKAEIEAYGIDKFVEACKARVDKYAKVQTEQSVRLGYWMDWDTDEDFQKRPDERRSYYTLAEVNNYTIWHFLKKCHERGYIYRGTDVMPWSGRAGSAYSDMEVKEGRRLTTHTSVFVRFPLRDREGEYLLIWTTTPWTLPGNLAVAVGPDITY